MKTLSLHPQNLALRALAIASAAAALAFVVLGSRSVAHPVSSSVTAICQQSKYTPNQPIVVAEADATASDQGPYLRTQYVQTLDAVATAASDEGAYLVVDTFGADPSKTKTLCATSTRVAGAAPLFVTARNAELRRVLEEVAQEAGAANDGARGSAIYGALVDAIQRVRALTSDPHVPVNVVLITDGDEVADGIHLRHLLESGASDAVIIRRIIGKLPLPDARVISSIELQGVGHAGTVRPISTTDARRMVQIWERICHLSHPGRCFVTTDLLDTQTFGR